MTRKHEPQRRFLTVGAAFVAAMLMAMPSSDAANPPPPATGQPAPVEMLKVLNHPKFGDYVTDQSGKPLYVTSNDVRGTATRQPQANCTDACLRVWPPASGSPKLAPEIAHEKVTSTKREDGLRQINLNGSPLYYYSVDSGGGAEPQGQGRADAGGTWYLVRPDGSPVKQSAP
jgi:predicted lipoprotein with Yx(FWY)xxD motif